MNRSETKICQNCKQNFVIEPEDFDFYKKIDVPAPTFCPECRLIRRSNFRNENTLYKVKCDLCGEITFSMYSKEESLIVSCINCWLSDKWDGQEYRFDYNWKEPFFKQFKRLSASVPRQSLFQVNSVNSQYGNIINNVKDIYLSYSITLTLSDRKMYMKTWKERKTIIVSILYFVVIVLILVLFTTV